MHYREDGYTSACLTRLLKHTQEFFHDTSSIVSIFWQKGSSHVYVQKPFHYIKYIHLSTWFQNCFQNVTKSTPTCFRNSDLFYLLAFITPWKWYEQRKTKDFTSIGSFVIKVYSCAQVFLCLETHFLQVQMNTYMLKLGTFTSCYLCRCAVVTFKAVIQNYHSAQKIQGFINLKIIPNTIHILREIAFKVKTILFYLI